jgi:lipopolysaccharide biosynthesis glycosyltransferase
LLTHGFKGEIYLITDKDVHIENVNVVKYFVNSVEECASVRLLIFNYIPFQQSDLILYIDTDIVICKPIPECIYNYDSSKVAVYGYSDRTQQCDSFAGFLTEDLSILNKPSFCTGILLFKPSEQIKDVFNETHEYYKKLLQIGKVNSAWEQPSICLKLTEHELVNVCLSDIVYEARNRFQFPPQDTTVFIHFCGGRDSNVLDLMNIYSTQTPSEEQCALPPTPVPTVSQHTE